MKNKYQNFSKRVLLGAAAVLIVAALAFSGSAKAGNLSPDATSAPTFFTLTDIWNRLTDNSEATEADHDLTTSASPASTFKTLKQIYEAIPTIVAGTVKSGTSYLGISGTLTPDGGTASTSDVFFGKTAHLTDDWNLDTGSLTLACAVSTFNGTDNKVSDAYDGNGNGNNRWCVTDSGTANASQITSGQICWVDGEEITGTMTSVGQQTITPTTSNQTITEGFHDGTGYCEGDADLVSTNIKSGTNIFGVAGDSNVVNTQTGDTLAANLLSGKICFSDGAEITGSMTDVGTQTVTPTTSNQTITEGFHDGTGSVEGDSDLEAEKIKNGIEIFNVTGTYSGYPGTGWTPNGSGDGSTALTEEACELYDNDGDPETPEVATGWYWFEDGSGDGDAANPDDPEDGICIQSDISVYGASSKSWNGDNDDAVRDNTYIAAYECEGNFPTGTITAGTYRGVDVVGTATFDTTWDTNDCALCQADCYDGKKDLPDNPYDAGSHYMPGEGSASPNHEGPLTPKILENWVGTRLPSSDDFFGYCGYKDGGSDYYETSCSSETTHGNYGQMIGRTDECMDLSNNGWEWLSEQHSNNGAGAAGGGACSYLDSRYGVAYGYRFRGVFRP